VWELRKGSRISRCELWKHSLGFELRCDVDGDVRQTAVQRCRETAEDVAVNWRQAFKARGWE
jgi:pentose-5-phosphate-3-epimerase